MGVSFIANDTGSVLEVTCQNDSDSSAINLTGATVTLRWNNIAGTTVEQAMTITNATGGVAQYQFTAGELEEGTTSYEVEITDSGGDIITSLKRLREKVGPKL